MSPGPSESVSLATGTAGGNAAKMMRGIERRLKVNPVKRIKLNNNFDVFIASHHFIHL
jgi:hypothetical protein